MEKDLILKKIKETHDDIKKHELQYTRMKTAHVLEILNYIYRFLEENITK